MGVIMIIAGILAWDICWVNYNALTVLPHWESFSFYREIIPFCDRTIQVSEML